MSSIEIFKSNLREIKEGNIVRLISDVLLYNLDKIRDYDSSETYYRDDVVYKKDTVNNKHNLYICLYDGVTGPFDPSKWDAYTFGISGSSVVLESSYVATSDGETVCPINQPLFNPSKNHLNVYHSVAGRLKKNIDWILDADDPTKIILQSFPLYTGETLIFEIFK